MNVYDMIRGYNIIYDAKVLKFKKIEEISFNDMRFLWLSTVNCSLENEFGIKTVACESMRSCIFTSLFTNK